MQEYGRNKGMRGAVVNYHEVKQIIEMGGCDGLTIVAASCLEMAEMGRWETGSGCC